MSERQAYDEVYAYSLTRAGPVFITQHVVDAFAAQTAEEQTKPITLTFALVGLYLHVERGFTGRQVQQAHQRIASRKRTWPSFALPVDRGSVTAADVLKRAAGPERDEAIHAWSASVWHAFRHTAPAVETLLSAYPKIFYNVARSA